MRFFTPGLFVRFNSPEDDEADQADEEWEEAIRGYRRHLDVLRDRMGSRVDELAGLSLHEAELLGFDQPTDPTSSGRFEPFPIRSGVGIVSLRQDDRVISLFYSLWDGIRRYEPEKSWPFSKQRPHWLYDEIDAVPGPFDPLVHRVLFSDGVVLEIPFLAVLVHSVALGTKDEGRASKQSA